MKAETPCANVISERANFIFLELSSSQRLIQKPGLSSSGLWRLMLQRKADVSHFFYCQTLALKFGNINLKRRIYSKPKDSTSKKIVLFTPLLKASFDAAQVENFSCMPKIYQWSAY
jgi:hypothetical protein